MTSIPLFLTHEHPCGYLEGEIAQSAFVQAPFHILSSIYPRLLAKGFRRSGNEVYTAHCARCSACIPARLEVAKFKDNRKQKRCWKKNINIQALIKPPVFYQAHYEMYQRYQNFRHTEGSMAYSSPYDYINFLSSSWCNTQFIEFSINNELAAVAVIDRIDNALSAVYTFFEPKFSSYSLGVYAILWEIEQAKLQHKEFLYLGFWIESCKKMTYKIEYKPIQLLINNRWTELSV
ncbi:Aspartate/glutamate leucyltransferase [Candidatus Methylobacter favarea]|uniref:Aspartate/glutamate leucyltransferase n=1 Tax=Candidatus Methylobacter favarea TaxID=2707345 RepID=A0A8S0YA75_9GAMM|nr:arginyltransferase [Candidatus Methylobacter favarea]CAA9891241.1 Aspartate/glutamate leucyltransferase [Candidatus Methylobacter favarea]